MSDELVLPSHLAHDVRTATYGTPQPAPADPSEWQEMIDARWPRDGRMPAAGRYSWYLLRWEPGWEWAPVNRWVIMQMIPKEHALRSQAFMVDFLEMDPPEIVYNKFAPKGQQIIHNGPPVTLAQHRLYQEWECVPHTFWIVQGKRGGHPGSFKPWDKKEAFLRGMPTEPPEPGSMPYAEPGPLMIHKIGEHEKRQLAAYNIAQLEKAEFMNDVMKKALGEQRERPSKMCDEAFDEIAEVAHGLLTPHSGSSKKKTHLANAIPTRRGDYVKMEEESREQFLKVE